jgi:hypothetical protein
MSPAPLRLCAFALRSFLFQTGFQLSIHFRKFQLFSLPTSLPSFPYVQIRLAVNACQRPVNGLVNDLTFATSRILNVHAACTGVPVVLPLCPSPSSSSSSSSASSSFPAASAIFRDPILPAFPRFRVSTFVLCPSPAPLRLRAAALKSWPDFGLWTLDFRL